MPNALKPHAQTVQDVQRRLDRINARIILSIATKYDGTIVCYAANNHIFYIHWYAPGNGYDLLLPSTEANSITDAWAVLDTRLEYSTRTHEDRVRGLTK